MARRYRNRRIGEFFKELDLTEGRCTGIPKMRAAMERNGSPEPRFSTDETRTHFVVELPVHPELVGLMLQDEAQDEAQDKAQDDLLDMTETEKRIVRSLFHGPSSVAEIIQVLGQKSLSGGTKLALHQLHQRGLISLTIPDKPNSKNQKRQLTDKGRNWLKENGDV